jgi:hypothetical protein
MALLDSFLVHRPPDVVLQLEILIILERIDFHAPDLDDDRVGDGLLRKSCVHEGTEEERGGNEGGHREVANLHEFSR